MVDICLFSDTHGMHRKVKLPACDIVICAGDYTGLGDKHEVQSFLSWFTSQKQCTHKIFISGNHDRHNDSKYNRETGADMWVKEVFDFYKVNHQDSKVYYIENELIEILGLRIYGSPITPNFYPDRWAFNVQRGERIRQVWDLIPKDLDILITHGPPLGYLDTVEDSPHLGCDELKHAVARVKPKIHVFGHIHDKGGMSVEEETTYVNASICNERYQVQNAPVIIKL